MSYYALPSLILQTELISVIIFLTGVVVTGGHDNLILVFTLDALGKCIYQSNTQASVEILISFYVLMSGQYKIT